MENIKITEKLISGGAKVPREAYPVRLAVATNVLFLTKSASTGEVNMLLYNYDPVNWKQAYPYFKSFSSEHNFKSDTYEKIIKEFQEFLHSNNYDFAERERQIGEDFCKTIGCSSARLTKIKEIEDEYWLKYSLSQKVWTLYLIEFFVATIEENDMVQLNSGDKFMLSINEKSIREIVDTGKFGELPIVDNTIEILKNKKIMKKLIDKASIIK